MTRRIVNAGKMPGMLCANCQRGVLLGGHLSDTTVAVACTICGLNLTAQLNNVKIEEVAA